MEAQLKYMYTFRTRFCTFVRSVGASKQNFCIGAQSEVYEESVVGWVCTVVELGSSSKCQDC